VGFDDVFHDAQAIPTPASRVAKFRTAAVEGLEDPHLVLTRNARALIAHAKAQRRP
jgi:hypothetical protein